MLSFSTAPQSSRSARPGDVAAWPHAPLCDDPFDDTPRSKISYQPGIRFLPWKFPLVSRKIRTVGRLAHRPRCERIATKGHQGVIVARFVRHASAAPRSTTRADYKRPLAAH